MISKIYLDKNKALNCFQMNGRALPPKQNYNWYDYNFLFFLLFLNYLLNFLINLMVFIMKMIEQKTIMILNICLQLF